MNVVVTNSALTLPRSLWCFYPRYARVADADFAVVYPQVNGLFGFAFDDNGVKTGAFQFGSPEATAFDLAIPPVIGDLAPMLLRAVPGAITRRWA